MRNIHDPIRTEFGRESVTIFRRWEQLEKKIADYCNHRRFMLRCLGQKITPTSLRLKKVPSRHQGESRSYKELRNNSWIKGLDLSTTTLMYVWI